MMLTKVTRRLRYWLHPAERQQRLGEELQAHLDFHIDELMEEGMSRQQAEARARRRFGNLTRTREDARAVWIARWADDLLQDLRYAGRTLRNQPGFAAVAILSSALGIGACSTIFAIANFALFHKLDVPDPDRVVAISRTFRGGPGDTVSYPVLLDLRTRQDSFASVAGEYPLVTGNLSVRGNSTRLPGAIVTANYFDVLGLQLPLGRGFDASHDQPGVPAAVVISDRLWRDQFGRDPGLVGQQLVFNGESTTLLGVAPPGFQGNEAGLASDFWIPIGMVDRNTFLNQNRGAAILAQRAVGWLGVIARLRADVTVPEARADLEVLAGQLQAAYPEFAEQGFAVDAAGPVNPGVREQAGPLFLVLLCVTALVLLIACANVANLLLARSVSRGQEIATRLAIGAPRGRLIRQLLTESGVLAMFGGMLGMLLAWWGTSLFSSIRLPVPIPLDLAVKHDYRVMLFTGGLSVMTGIAFGLVPALRATRRDLTQSLKDAAPLSARRRFPLTGGLVVMQVAVSSLLLIATGLFLRSLSAATAIDTGMSTSNLLFVSVDPVTSGYRTEQSLAFLETARQRIGSLAGVRSASYTNLIPLSLGGLSRVFVPEERQGQPEEYGIRADLVTVGPDYFETFGIPLLRGRGFGSELPGDEPVVIVNDEFARRAFGDQNPLGRRITAPERFTVIGVVRTSKMRTIGEDPVPAVFQPAAQRLGYASTPVGMAIVVRTEGPPGALVAAVRQEIATLDPNMPVFDVKTIDTHLRAALVLPRAAAILFGLFGGMGLLIATIGVYGMVSFSVARRTREIGIRMALGARRGQVVGALMRGGVWMIGIGLAIGTVTALGAMRVASSVLYGVSPTDLVTFVAVPVLLGSIALTATLLPARKAAQLDPARTLRDG